MGFDPDSNHDYYTGTHTILISKPDVLFPIHDHLDTIDLVNDLGLIPTSRPIVVPPKVNETWLDIPGAMGNKDLSQILNGYPTYGLREGSWSFYILNDAGEVPREPHSPWLVRPKKLPCIKNMNIAGLYHFLCTKLHGRKFWVTLEDDDDTFYHYEGFLTVEAPKNGNTWSTITIKYKFDPYRYYNWTADQSFIFGNQTDMFMTLPYTFEELAGKACECSRLHNVCTMPIHPTLTVRESNDGSVKMRFVNEELNIDLTQYIPTGTNFLPRVTISDMLGIENSIVTNSNFSDRYPSQIPSVHNNCYMAIEGSGAVKLDFRPAIL